MYSYTWDAETGGFLLNSSPLAFSKEPRPVYYKELDILGFDKFWNYDKNDTFPYMWAEANNYYYRGRLVGKTKGGALYTAPEIILIEDPEPDRMPLRFVDIPAMVDKNRDLLEKLVQDTIKKIYNTYVEYKDRVDVFYVAFSGGKDSVATLDLVQRTLPHNDFKVLFGDTGMEFPDTYDVVETVKKICTDSDIAFLTAHSTLTPEYTWSKIGPPAQKMRWCCSVHKTTPQILLLRKITNNPQFRGMAMMGVRADESYSRSQYNELNYGTKHNGQFDYYPIFNWNSAELFLYIYKENLILNSTYKSGNSRAGCLVCPMEAVKNTWFKEQSYHSSTDMRNTTTFFNNIILEKTIAKALPQKNVREFMEIGVWKSRHNGKKLLCPEDLYEDNLKDGILTIHLKKMSVDWKEWLKTVGEYSFIDENNVNIFYQNKAYKINYEIINGEYIFRIYVGSNTKNDIYFMSYMKNVFRKSAYCITCQVCEANCPYGYIKMSNGKVTIDDKCVKCQMCHKIDNGCLVATSQIVSKERMQMNGSIDRYKNMGVRYTWVSDYLKHLDSFWENNDLGTMMLTALKSFLSDANMVEKRHKVNKFGMLIASMGAESASAWALMLCNLTYSPQFSWWIKNIKFNETYTEDQLKYMLSNVVTSDNSRKNIVSGFKFILYTNPILSSEIGLGQCICKENGRILSLLSITRTPWQNPDPLVILYSLYKFAEACGNYYQFPLSRLLAHDIDSDGVSPTEIFGLGRDQMEKLLNGLSTNHSDFITASFTLDLENITLNSDKTSQDVLSLY